MQSQTAIKQESDVILMIKEQSGSISGVTCRSSKESAALVLTVCQDILDLYKLYEHNWFDKDGIRVPIISATLQMVNIDFDSIDVLLYLQMADVTENSIYQLVAQELTAKEASAVFEFSKAAIGCHLGMIASE